tara:strand:+ start:880 stop:1074 length:195 start_codon:yes stop_codon:yes gene_type:complete
MQIGIDLGANKIEFVQLDKIGIMSRKNKINTLFIKELHGDVSALIDQLDWDKRLMIKLNNKIYI